MNFPLFLQRKVNKAKKPLRIFWWRYEYPTRLNFGDEITPDIVQKLWGYKCEWAKVEDCEIVGVGSVLGMVLRENKKNHKIKVWGSGFIKAIDVVDDKDLDYYAIRGPLSLKQVNSKIEIALGDPGILANLVYKRASSITHRVGVVAHYVDQDNPLLSKIRKIKNVKLIDPLQTPAKVAEDITSCEVIFSSSLHGLIFADSFGVPNYWTPLSEKVIGGNYKFNDYYLSTGRQLVKKKLQDVINDNDEIKTAIDSYEPINDLKDMQKKLIRSFPYQIEFKIKSIILFICTPSRWKAIISR